MLAKDYVEKIHPIPEDEINQAKPHQNLEEFDEFDKGVLPISQNVSIAKKSFQVLIKQLQQDKSIIFEKGNCS